MRARPLSIREILWLTISALTFMIALLVGQETYVRWQQLQKIEALKDANLFTDKLFDATEKLSVERDVAYAMLHAPDGEDMTDLRTRLNDSRRDTDMAFAQATSSIVHYPFPELGKLDKNVEDHLAGIRLLRSQIDQSIALPKNQRKTALAGQWYEDVTTLISETQNLWTQFISHFTDINPMVTQQLRYKHFLLIVSDYTGRERSLIGKLLVENADPSPEEIGQLLRWQGKIELGWQMAQLLASQSGLYASIGPTFKDAESHYQTMYDMVRDIFYIPGIRHGNSYPISADIWFELSTQSADSLNALKEASQAAKHAFLNKLEDDGRKAIALHLGILVFALGLCFYCFRIISHRVIRPINAMVEALLDTIQGKAVSFIPDAANPQDEIGKLAEVLHAFQATVERYRALVEASSQIIWTWQPGETGEMGALEEWWEKTTGQPGSEILPFGWLEVVHPEDRERAQLTWANASARGENFDMEYRLRARSGNYRWIYVRGVALKDTDGAMREMVGALNDITERKEAENALMMYTRALERSNKELDDFAYIASHDLKEPLRGIHNHSCFLLEDNQDKLDPDSVSKLNRLVYLSQRMERLVNDLLYFSRLGRQELAIQPTDLNSVIHDIETMLEIFLHDRHATILIPKPLPIITCDATRITEAFRNLVTNAVKYNDKPEKTVEIGCLDNHASPEGDMLAHVFYVKDNGNGIAQEFYQEVFRIFKRLQSSKDGAEEGTGVGLTFVKKIIERHGGRIWLESETGIGTTFYFTLGEMHHDSGYEAA